MNWDTVYIIGKRDFRDDVRRKLERSNIDVVPGYIVDTGAEITHDLFWIDENTNIQTFKEAIGSKLIFKYRLRFYTTLEDFIESQNNSSGADELTKEELELIATMRSRS